MNDVLDVDKTIEMRYILFTMSKSGSILNSTNI